MERRQKNALSLKTSTQESKQSKLWAKGIATDEKDTSWEWISSVYTSNGDKMALFLQENLPICPRFQYHSSLLTPHSQRLEKLLTPESLYQNKHFQWNNFVSHRGTEGTEFYWKIPLCPLCLRVKSWRSYFYTVSYSSSLTLFPMGPSLFPGK